MLWHYRYRVNGKPERVTRQGLGPEVQEERGLRRGRRHAHRARSRDRALAPRSSTIR
jgi:hypothetical protein